MSENEELTALINRSDHLGVLRYIRAHKLREPSLVLAQSDALLPTTLDKPNKIDESERLAALEQICMAALDATKFKLAEDVLIKIKAAAGKESVRYRVLLGLCLESQDDFDSAGQVYDALLKENPSNVHVLKRKYCILKAQIMVKVEDLNKGGQHAMMEKQIEARKALNNYLERNGSDTGAWVEMARVCVEQGDYAGAAYCYEEVVLSSPLDSEIHCKLGELYASAGGVDNLKLARKHLAQSLELDPKNLRASYALVSSAEAYLEDIEKDSGKKKKRKEVHIDDDDLCKDILNFGKEKLLSSYKGSSMSGLVENVLAQIGDEK